MELFRGWTGFEVIVQRNPPWGVVVSYTMVLVSGRPHPREGYNYYITCYLGNITVEERYENIFRCCLGNRLYYAKDLYIVFVVSDFQYHDFCEVHRIRNAQTSFFHLKIDFKNLEISLIILGIVYTHLSTLDHISFQRKWPQDITAHIKYLNNAWHQLSARVG